MSICYHDGDVLCYSSGFSAETRFYEVEGPDGTASFPYVKDARNFLEEKGLDGEPRLIQVAQPFEVARLNLDSMIRAAEKMSGMNGSKIFLTDPSLENNSRFKNKVHVDYKASRKGAVKPVHHKALREYIINTYLSEVVSGIEADDALAMALTDDPGSCVASIDKDLLMVPGLHYNYRTRAMISVKDPGQLEIIVNDGGKKVLKGYGFMWFCAQCFIGDAIDNIPGLPRVGPVKAYSLLYNKTSHRDLWAVVKGEYHRRGFLHRLDEVAFCLWLQRRAGENWENYLEK